MFVLVLGKMMALKAAEVATAAAERLLHLPSELAGPSKVVELTSLLELHCPLSPSYFPILHRHLELNLLLGRFLNSRFLEKANWLEEGFADWIQSFPDFVIHGELPLRDERNSDYLAHT